MQRTIDLSALFVAAVAAAGGLAAQQAEYETTRIADGVYQFRFRSHNGFIVVGGRGVVAVDPISVEAAEHLAAEIRRLAPDRPLYAIVYSHDHADHATGAGVLRRVLGGDPPIIAHRAARPKLEGRGPDLPAPNLTFDDRLVLHVDPAVELRYLGPSHSDNMIVALVPERRVVFAVDFVSNDRVGYRDLPDYHFDGLVPAIERLAALPFDRIVFGHGPPGDRATVERQAQYYRDLFAAVQTAVRNGWTEDEAAARVRLPAYEGWGQYAEWFPLNVRAVYRWLRGEGSGR